ncbi:MAG: HAD domain-containing protein [Agathobacter sp.]|nr:HAD domain-containing protein [Agathobacter sp.]
MSRVIFLDVDGVLNTKADWKRMYTLDSKCVSEFCHFAKRMQVDVVLTSSWRTGYSGGDGTDSEPICRLTEMLAKEGVRIIGKTPDLGKRRAAEVERYLYYHPEVTEYIIIDDDPAEFEKSIPGCYFVDAGMGFKDSKKIKLSKI